MNDTSVGTLRATSGELGTRFTMAATAAVSLLLLMVASSCGDGDEHGGMGGNQQGGTGGTGGGEEPHGDRCQSNGHCVGLAGPNLCIEAFCDIRDGDQEGLCSTMFVPAGKVLSAKDQTFGDCKAKQCDGEGNLIEVNDDNDPPVTHDPCKWSVCNDGVGSIVDVEVGTPCGPGVYCNEQMECV